MNHGKTATRLLPFQEPYREYYGKSVRIHRFSGKPAIGELLSPVFSLLPPAHKLYIRGKSGNIRKISMENVQKLEVLK